MVRDHHPEETRETDRQTDRQTEISLTQRYYSSVMSDGQSLRDQPVRDHPEERPFLF